MPGPIERIGGATQAELDVVRRHVLFSTADGTAAKPIVIKSAGDGEVVFDGGGNAVLFDLTAADYQYVEGITVRNTDVAFLLGRKRILGAVGFTLSG